MSGPRTSTSAYARSLSESLPYFRQSNIAWRRRVASCVTTVSRSRSVDGSMIWRPMGEASRWWWIWWNVWSCCEAGAADGGGYGGERVSPEMTTTTGEALVLNKVPLKQRVLGALLRNGRKTIHLGLLEEGCSVRLSWTVYAVDEDFRDMTRGGMSSLL